MQHMETTSGNSELEAEQAYVDHAYECLERTRRAATALRDVGRVEGPGGTFQARFEQDVLVDHVLSLIHI